MPLCRQPSGCELELYRWIAQTSARTQHPHLGRTQVRACRMQAQDDGEMAGCKPALHSRLTPSWPLVSAVRYSESACLVKVLVADINLPMPCILQHFQGFEQPSQLGRRWDRCTCQRTSSPKRRSFPLIAKQQRTQPDERLTSNIR